MMPIPDWMRPSWKDAQGRTRRIASGPSKAAVEAYAAKCGLAVESFYEIETAHARQSLTNNWHQPPAKTVRVFGLLTA